MPHRHRSHGGAPHVGLYAARPGGDVASIFGASYGAERRAALREVMQSGHVSPYH
jgi:hypothetical protein